MAYTKRKLFKRALEVAESEQCFFIEEVCCKIPCSKTMFYEKFPVGSNEMNEVKKLLASNRVKTTGTMIRKWVTSDAPALQIGAMKILGTKKQAHALNGTKTETTLKGDKENPIQIDDEVGRNKLIAELTAELSASGILTKQ